MRPKLIGCYKALRDQGEEDKGIKLGSAVGFVNSIKASKAITASFANVVRSLDAQENDGFTCETQHIDGTDNTIDRNKKLYMAEGKRRLYLTTTKKILPYSHEFQMPD